MVTVDYSRLRLGGRSRLFRQTFSESPFMVLAICYGLQELCPLWYGLMCAGIRVCPSVACARCSDGLYKCFSAPIVLQDKDLQGEILSALSVMNFTGVWLPPRFLERQGGHLNHSPTGCC